MKIRGEIGYSFERAGGAFLNDGRSRFDAHIVEAGVNVRSPWRYRSLVPFARAGGQLWLGNMRVSGSGTYDDQAMSLGIYAGGGLSLRRPMNRYGVADVAMNLEFGHLLAQGLEYEEQHFGRLGLSGMYSSLSVELGF